YEQAAMALLQRQEFPEARQILHEALDDPKLPAARAAGLRGLLSGTFGGEIGQLTAQAILSIQEGREAEALGVLQRAEGLLAAMALHELVRRGLELGITEDELVAAFARVRRLCEELGMDARA